MLLKQQKNLLKSQKQLKTIKLSKPQFTFFGKIMIKNHHH